MVGIKRAMISARIEMEGIARRCNRSGGEMGINSARSRVGPRGRNEGLDGVYAVVVVVKWRRAPLCPDRNDKRGRAAGLVGCSSTTGGGVELFTAE